MSSREGCETNDARRTLIDEVERLGPRIVKLARDLYRHPEVGLEEFHSAARLSGDLEEEGFEVRMGLCDLPTAFSAEKRHGKGPSIAFLAEYDALPGLGHAGGHNLIAAVSYGAAVALGRRLEDHPGRVVLFGTPAEETIGGKVVMARQGAFDAIDVAMLAHPGSRDRVEVRSLASWSVDVVFEGKSSHAVAAPEQGVNALDAVIQLFTARDALLKSLRDEVRIPGVILEGGVQPNVVPDRARARFSMRAADATYLMQTVLTRFRELVEGVARTTQTRATMHFVDNLYDEMCSSPGLAEIYRRNALEVGLDPTSQASSSVASLDTGIVSKLVPVIHPVFRIVENPVASHTVEFAKAVDQPRALESAVRVAKALALTGLDLLADPAIVRRLGDEHRDSARHSSLALDTPLITSQVSP